LPDIKKIIQGFNIPVVELDGYEADDVIGTVAWQAADMGYSVYMVTPDKDYGQLLIHPQVYIYKPPSFGNAEEIVTAEKICEKWGIARVEQVVDMLGLMGDAVDNIPGIAGVGEKTACALTSPTKFKPEKVNAILFFFFRFVSGF
jgi:DNA polymerase-1